MSWVAIFDQPATAGPWGTGISGIPGGSPFGSAYGVGEALVEAITAAIMADYGGPVAGQVLVGWPTPNQLNIIIANGGGQVTVYPVQGTWRNADRYRPQYEVPTYENPPQLLVELTGSAVVFSGIVDQPMSVTIQVVPFGKTLAKEVTFALGSTDSPETAAVAFQTAINNLGIFGLAGIAMTTTAILVAGGRAVDSSVRPIAILNPVISGSTLSFEGPADANAPLGQPYLVHVFVGPTRSSEVDAVTSLLATDTISTMLPKIKTSIQALNIHGLHVAIVGETLQFTGTNYLASNVGMQAHLVGEFGRVSGSWQVSVWMPDAYSRAEIEEIIFENIGTLDTPFLALGSSAAAIRVNYAGGRAAGWVDRSQSDFGCYESHMNFDCEWPILKAEPATQVGAVKPTLAAFSGNAP